MRTVLIAAIAAALVGCGKKESPAPAATALVCMDVVVVRIDGSGAAATTYMDNAFPPEGQLPQRFARSGEWGAVGDKFRHCD